MKKRCRPKVTRKIAMRLAEIAANGTPRQLADEIQRVIKSRRIPQKSYWHRDLNRLAAIALSFIPGEKPAKYFEILSFENSKLPFAQFSALPIFTCPGRGNCVEWCYSLLSWRYSAAFCRQCQNTLLLRFNRRAIITEFQKIEYGSAFRLYVDGDFSDESTAVFWWNLIRQRPDIHAYGYSKSLPIIDRTAHLVPANYTLNLSTGGAHDEDAELISRLKSYPFTRAAFIPVSIDSKFKSAGFARYDDPEYHRAVRRAAEDAGFGRVFSCPGKCGTCTGKGHACGTRNPDGSHLVPITIAIGIH